MSNNQSGMYDVAMYIERLDLESLAALVLERNPVVPQEPPDPIPEQEPEPEPEPEEEPEREPLPVGTHNRKQLS